MPYKVEYRPTKKSKKDWVIINRRTGRIVGRSTSERKAETSVRARLASEHGWRKRKEKENGI